MTPINKITFKELEEYLNSQDCFGLTVTRREHILVYHFVRYYNKIRLSLNVLVSRKTKFVIGVTTENKTYEDLDELKEFVKRK